MEGTLLFFVRLINRLNERLAEDNLMETIENHLTYEVLQQ